MRERGRSKLSPLIVLGPSGSRYQNTRERLVALLEHRQEQRVWSPRRNNPAADKKQKTLAGWWSGVLTLPAAPIFPRAGRRG